MTERRDALLYFKDSETLHLVLIGSKSTHEDDKVATSVDAAISMYDRKSSG